MSERWRCFVAVSIGESLRSALAQTVAGWTFEGLRCTDPANWHLTLAFLGPTDPDHVAFIEDAIEKVAFAHGPMQLRTGGLGAFPSPGRARVLWYGVEDPVGELDALARDLHSELGIEMAGPYRPHLTLARARRQPVNLAPWLADASAPAGELVVDRLQLIRSHLGGGPARHEVVGSASLGVAAHV
jgi:2'-5' RNA ligase